jgi:small-conductance mechanosensitive channel
MNFDPMVIVDSTTTMVNTFLAHLPRLALAMAVLLLFVLLGRLAGYLVRRVTGRFAELGSIALGRLARWLINVIGFLVALAIVFPSVNIGTLVSALGITSVAFGFAFRDVLENFFGGLILLLTEPYQIGDQIIVGEHEGTVKRIEARATTVHTYDGRDVVIPNATLMTQAVIVNTAHAVRRSEYEVGIGYGDDVVLAKRLMVEAMQGVEGVLAEPAPDTLLMAFGEYSVNIRARWWTDSTRSSVIHIHDRVLTAMFRQLGDHSIDIAFPTYQLLFHDQTEETDGDRKRQREGWPAPRNGTAPQPARIADALGRLSQAAQQASNGATG